MLNFSDKREHFRFPAYDDEAGVKLVKKRRKDFLKDILDDGFTYKEARNSSSKFHKKNKVKTMTIDPVEMVEEPDYFGYEKMPNMEDAYSSPKSKTNNFQQKNVTVEQITRTIDKTNTYIEPVDEHFVSPQSSFANKLVETDSNGNAKYHKNEKNKKPFESSYHLPGAKEKNIFKPKHIPASLIDESDEDEQLKRNRHVIIDELRKVASENRFMIEDEAVLDPIVDIVDNQVEQPLDGVLEKSKNTRLEKKLSGIMADEKSPQLDSYYFD